MSLLSENDKISILSRVEESPAAMILLEECKKIYDDKTREVVNNGKICDTNFCNDFRHILGVAAGMRILLNKVKDAKEQVKKL